MFGNVAAAQTQTGRTGSVGRARGALGTGDAVLWVLQRLCERAGAEQSLPGAEFPGAAEVKPLGTAPQQLPLAGLGCACIPSQPAGTGKLRHPPSHKPSFLWLGLGPRIASWFCQGLNEIFISTVLKADTALGYQIVWVFKIELISS